MRKPKSRTLDIRKSYASNNATIICLPKDQTKYAKLEAGDPVAVLQIREGEKIDVKDGDIIIRNLKGVI